MDRMCLGINIDHVATIRNARGGDHPSPVEIAKIAENNNGTFLALPIVGMDLRQ